MADIPHPPGTGRVPPACPTTGRSEEFFILSIINMLSEIIQTMLQV